MELFNTKIKIYPSGFKKVVYSNHSIFHYPIEDKKPSDDEDCLSLSSSQEEKDDYDEKYVTDEVPKEWLGNLKHTKDHFFDLVYMNTDKWFYFLTLTIDPKQMDRSDPQEVSKLLQIWLQNRVARHGLVYLLVPEYHADGESIHMHALVNDRLKVVDSGTVHVEGVKRPMRRENADKFYPDRKKLIVYNVPDWKYGYTTAVKIYGDGVALSQYVTKYLVKGNDKIFGKYYFSSKNIRREPEIQLCNTDFYLDSSTENLPEYQVPRTGLLLKYDVDDFAILKGVMNRDPS